MAVGAKSLGTKSDVYYSTKYVVQSTKEGTQTVYHGGEAPVRWQDADTEGAQIIEQQLVARH